MEGQRPFLDSLPTIPSPLSLSIYPSLSSLPRPSFSQSTSFPSFIDFFAVVDSRYVILLRARDGKEGGRLSLSTAHTAAQPQLTRFAYLLRSFASFLLCAIEAATEGKERGEQKVCVRAVASADTKCCRIPWAHAYWSVCRSPAGSHATVFGPFSMPLLSTHQTPRSTSSTKEKRGEFLPFATACCLLLLLLLRLSRSAFPPSILRDATAPVQMQHAMHVAGPPAAAPPSAALFVLEPDAPRVVSRAIFCTRPFC